MTKAPALTRRRNLFSGRRRRGVVILLALAVAMFTLLLLGGLARRAVLEQRAIDAQREALQADWLLWSSERRVRQAWSSGETHPAEWRMAFDQDALENMVASQVVPHESSSNGASPPQWRLEMRWTTPKGVVLERSRLLLPLNSTPK